MEVDTDLLFYFYCYKMGLSEREFWNSPLKKVLKLIDIYTDEQNMLRAQMDHAEYQSQYFSDEPEVQEITSMKEIEGWV